VKDERVVMTYAKAKWIQKFGDRVSLFISQKNFFELFLQMITLGKEGGMANEQRLSNWLMVKIYKFVLKNIHPFLYTG